MSEFKIYTNWDEFSKETGKQSLNGSRPMGEIYSEVSDRLKRKINVDTFIAEIGQIMQKNGEGMCRPKRSNDTLSCSAGRGMDSLSEWLKSKHISQKDYEAIMAYSMFGYLDENYRS